MSETLVIPKFRNTSRLVQFVAKNWSSINSRLPPDREEVFFKTKEEPARVATNLYAYSNYVGKMPERFEELLKANKQSLLNYIVRMDNTGLHCEALLDDLRGHGMLLYRWAKSTDKRLPEHLEGSIEDPNPAYYYAKEVIRGRLPAHMEKVFFKDPYWASKYAFDVIRGFAPVKLPDDLHSFMVLKSFEDPDDDTIKAYIEASENDPNKSGNTP